MKLTRAVWITLTAATLEAGSAWGAWALPVAETPGGPKTAAGGVPLIPREVLFGNPERISPQLSPDGKLLAYLAPDSGTLNVWVRTLGRDDDRALTRDRRRGIRGYFWAPNGQQLLYVQDKAGDENWHVWSVPAEGGESTDLTPLPGVQAQIVAVERTQPDRILIGLNDRSPKIYDLYGLDLKTGERILEVKNDLNAVRWNANHELKVTLAQVPSPDGGFVLKRREGDLWKGLLTWSSEDALSSGTVGFSEDNQTLYVISSAFANAANLRALDLERGGQEVLASDPDYDVGNILMHPTTYAIQAVSFNKDRREWKVLDPSLQGDFDALARLHPGDLAVVDRDVSDKTWLVAFTQDRGAIDYFSYDRPTHQGTFLFAASSKLEGLPLATMRPVTFQARDGLTLHGYLTLPVGVEPKDLPAVLNVHGGPWSRNSWGYDPEAQWLANRGYACLQVNFRGSIGYGKKFLNAGNLEWGGKMQDDIADGAAWLMRQGIADPKRIGIYGASFGGFAVLCGLTKSPDLYACGVDMVGPSNLISFINTIPPYWAPLKAVFDKRVGNPVTDEALLKAQSPLYHVDRIQAPVLIAQGANDPRVKLEETHQIRDALQNAGKRVEYLEFADEGHGFANPENRLVFYARAEAFLAQVLGGRFEPVR